MYIVNPFTWIIRRFDLEWQAKLWKYKWTFLSDYSGLVETKVGLQLLWSLSMRVFYNQQVADKWLTKSADQSCVSASFWRPLHWRAAMLDLFSLSWNDLAWTRLRSVIPLKGELASSFGLCASRLRYRFTIQEGRPIARKFNTNFWNLTCNQLFNEPYSASKWFSDAFRLPEKRLNGFLGFNILLNGKTHIETRWTESSVGFTPLEL